jgi:methylmalonyl-CoA/ethylmalonyl-CoA epimerase
VTALAIDMLLLPPRGDPSFAGWCGLVSARTDHRSASLMSDTPRRGTRIAHVGLAVRSAADLHSFYRNVLGMSEADLADSDGARISGFMAGDALVELLEAEAPDSPIGKFLAKRGPGIHHICLSVDDLDGTLERCRQAGMRLIDERPRVGAEGKRIAFLHPSSTGGILIELSEH